MALIGCWDWWVNQRSETISRLGALQEARRREEAQETQSLMCMEGGLKQRMKKVGGLVEMWHLHRGEGCEVLVEALEVVG